MMYSQAKLYEEDSYKYQQGYESQRGCYNDPYSDPYGYGYTTSQQENQTRRPPLRTYDDEMEYGDYNYSKRAPPPPQRRSFYDDPPESYQESSYDLDYEHSRRAQPLRGDTSYDQSREYRTPRYYPDSYEEEYHDQEDYYYEHRRDKPQGKYGLSEETWALARRLGINIVPDDSMEENIRVTPRVDQDAHNHSQQVSFKVPVEEVIEDIRESELEIPVGDELQDQEKENQDGEYRNELEEKEDEEVDQSSCGKTIEAHCGKILDSSCGKTTLGNNCAKSWADICDEDNDDDCDDIGVLNCVDHCNINCVDDGVEEIIDMNRDINCMIKNVEDAFVEPSSDEIGGKKHGDSCNESCIDSCDEDCIDTCVENVVVVDMVGEVVNEERSAYENVEKKESVEGKEKNEKEESKNENQEIMVEVGEKEKEKEHVGKEEKTREESARVEVEDKMKDNKVEPKEERKDKEKNKMEENSILLDVDSCQPLEESVLCVNLKEFVNARHLMIYLEERVDGEKTLISIQVFMDGRL